MIKDACPEAYRAWNSNEFLKILSDVENFKKDPLKAMKFIYLAQIGSFVFPNNMWVHSDTSTWILEHEFYFLPLQNKMNERQKKGFLHALFWTKLFNLCKKILKHYQT